MAFSLKFLIWWKSDVPLNISHVPLVPWEPLFYMYQRYAFWISLSCFQCVSQNKTSPPLNFKFNPIIVSIYFPTFVHYFKKFGMLVASNVKYELITKSILIIKKLNLPEPFTFSWQTNFILNWQKNRF